MPERNTETVTRGESKAPEQLAALISLVNADERYDRPAFPSDKEIRRVAKLRFEEKIGAEEDLCTQVVMEQIRSYRRFADQLSDETQAFLGPPELPTRFRRNWMLLESATTILLQITEKNKVRSMPSFGEVFAKARANPPIPVHVPFRQGLEFARVDVGLTVDEEGRVAASNNFVLDALRGVLVERIRACSVCGTIFWASRSTSRCCKKTCRKTLNQRDSRVNRLEAKARAKRQAARKSKGR